MSNEPGAELAGRVRSRPLRIAFLVESGEHAALMLDGVFADCYSRWGGRFSLVVPCVNCQIVAAYWQWLEAFDPDIVYSYINLAAEAVLEIHERLCVKIVDRKRFLSPLPSSDQILGCPCASGIARRSRKYSSRL